MPTRPAQQRWKCALAEERAPDINAEDILLPPNEVLAHPETLGTAWKEICDAFQARWHSAYVERVVEYWEAMKADQEDEDS